MYKIIRVYSSREMSKAVANMRLSEWIWRLVGVERAKQGAVFPGWPACLPREHQQAGLAQAGRAGGRSTWSFPRQAVPAQPTPFLPYLWEQVGCSESKHSVFHWQIRVLKSSVAAEPSEEPEQGAFPPHFIIFTDDFVTGDGRRLSLQVSGTSHNCWTAGRKYTTPKPHQALHFSSNTDENISLTCSVSFPP